MARYDENMGTMQYDNLIASGKIGLVTGARNVRAGQGVLKRGTVLALSSGTAGDGAAVLLGTTAASNETLTVDCVLCDDLDTGTEKGDAITALVYLSGHFLADGLTVKEESALAAAEIETLRTKGIFVDG